MYISLLHILFIFRYNIKELIHKNCIFIKTKIKFLFVLCVQQVLITERDF